MQLLLCKTWRLAPLALSLIAFGASAQSLTDSQRSAATSATATSKTNACSAIAPFVWEMGHADARVVTGVVSVPGARTRITPTVPMSIASASKWVYAAYVAERSAGALNAVDQQMLSMRSGYVSLTTCSGSPSVDACLAKGQNGAYSASFDGRFVYNGGHMEKHASLAGLGAMGNAALASEMRAWLGSDIDIRFSQPLLAGGMVMSSDAYGRLLRKMMRGQLAMGQLLGSDPVCTNANTCGLDVAVAAPVPAEETWHYSAGHWIEDDPELGDGTFSSPGAMGFYPWISADKSSYGVIARVDSGGTGAPHASVQCGRLLRKAWETGVAH